MDSTQSESQPRSSSKFEIGFLSFVGGAICTGIVSIFLCTARTAADQAHLQSEVHDPVRFALDDIVKTYESDEPEMAVKKTRILQAGWSSYLDGGPKPEVCVQEIVRLRATEPAIRAIE